MIETKFKKSEVGLIPEEWEVKTFENICSTKSGGTPSREIKEYYKGNIPWVTTGELNDGDLYDTTEHISESALQHSSAKVFPSGTLLMAMYGATIGKLGITQVEAATNQACCAIFLKEDYQKYVFYKLLFDRPQLIAKGYGAGQPNISQAVIKKLQYAFPKINEQKHIAVALSDIDDLISTTKKLIEKKRNIKQGAMQELLTGNRRLPGFTDEWMESRVGEFGEMIRGVSYSAEEASTEEYVNSIPLLRSNNIQNNCVNYDNLVYVPRTNVNNSQFLKSGDILICMANGSKELVGKTGLVKENIISTFGAFMGVFRLYDIANACYIAQLLLSDIYKSFLKDVFTGSAINNLKSSDIENITFYMPSSSAEKQAIAKVLSDMDSEISSLESRLIKYQSLKQGMMQQLLTGKIRLI